MSPPNTSPRASRASIPATLAELSAFVDAPDAVRPASPMLRAVVREALREGAFAVPSPLMTPDTVIWFD